VYTPGKSDVFMAVSPDGNLALVGDRGKGGIILSQMGADRKMHPLTYFGAANNLSFDDTSRYAEKPVISPIAPVKLWYHKAAFLGNKTIVFMERVLPTIHVVDISDPGNPLELFTDTISAPDDRPLTSYIMMDVVADAANARFYVTVNQALEGNPIVDRFKHLGSPEAIGDYNGDDNVGEYAGEFEKNFVASYSWKWND
jgi:hypothetical protein